MENIMGKAYEAKRTATDTMAALALLIAAIFMALPAMAGEKAHAGNVVITSPADGEAINGGTVDVVIELRDKGRRGDHVHLYIDGKLVKPLYGRRVVYTFNGLSRGRHTITVKIATKGHSVLDTEDSVTVTVR
jgi:hypothetical protein